MRLPVRRARRRLRPYKSTLVLLLAILVLSLVWVGVRGALAARQLEALQRGLTTLQAASTSPGGADLGPLERSVAKHARSASGYTHDVVWKLWARAPFVGSSLSVVSGVSEQSDRLSRRALPTLVEAAQIVRSVRATDGTFNVDLLSRRAVALHQAAADLSAASATIDALPRSRIGPLERSRTKLDNELTMLAGRSQALAVGASVAPELLGFSGIRHYLVAVQNNAEARASGGIVGAYGIVAMTRGKPSLQVFGSDVDLHALSENAIDFGTEWRQRYDALAQARDWREVTSTPDFPTAAKAMLALWRATHDGQQLDGVVSVDPLALADILRATGPLITPSGITLTGATFVQVTLSDAYRDFPDKDDRSKVLSDHAKVVFDALLKGAGRPLVLGERLGHAIVGGHFKIYSATGATQRQLATAAISGALPASAQPLLSVITQDGNADKLTYYLRRSITYDAPASNQLLDFGDGRGPQRQDVGTASITLTNTAPATGLPDYVAPGIDLATGRALPRGQMHLSLSVYLGASGQVEMGALDGKAINLGSQTEQGLSVFTTSVSLDPGATRTIQLTIRQPAPLGRPLLVLPQPLVTPDALLIKSGEG